MMRRHAFPVRLAAMLMVLAVLAFCGRLPGFALPTAFAEDGREQLSLQMSAKPNELVEPGDVMLSFSITNSSAVDAQNVYLSSADGLLSEPVGRIAAGETQVFNRQHSVTQAELDDGKISYIVSHDDPFDPAAKVNYTVVTPILRSDLAPQVEFTRQFSSRSAAAGSTLVITYRIRNTGNVALSNLRVQDTLGDYTGRVDRLAVGESRTLISRATITEESVSSAVLDYHADGTEELYTSTLDDVTVHIARAALEAELSAAYSPFRQSSADVVLILSNTGNADIRDITITDDIYGGVIADSIALPAGSEPVEVGHAYPVRSNAGYRWRIRGVSESGEVIEIATENVALLPPSAGEDVNLSLAAAARTPRIRRSGDVTVDVRISNPGASDVYDVTLTEESAGELRRFTVVPAGGAVERSFSFNISEDTACCFSISYTSASGTPRSVSCAPVEIVIASDGVLPEGAKTAFIEFTGSSIKIGGSSTFAVLLIAGCVVLLILVIMLLVASRKARLEKQLRIAAEKRRRKEEMGKTNRFTPVRAPKNKNKGRSN